MLGTSVYGSVAKVLQKQGSFFASKQEVQLPGLTFTKCESKTFTEE